MYLEKAAVQQYALIVWSSFPNCPSTSYLHYCVIPHLHLFSKFLSFELSMKYDRQLTKDSLATLYCHVQAEAPYHP